MSGFTLAYLARLELWGLAAAVVQGGLVWLSWLAWERAAARTSPRLRHALACAHFGAVLALPVVTVLVLHVTALGMAGAPAGTGEAQPSALIGADGAVVGIAALAGLIWLAGAAVMLARLGREARGIARLGRSLAPGALVESVERLARSWPLRATPRVRLAAVAAPQVVGLWRPVLLAPTGLAERLDAGEREAVLLHELAHVRRGDFGWNLLQRLALAVVWFHPAAWALYRRVAGEREACCDALAVRHGAAPADLARALVRLAEGRARDELAMAAAPRRSGLAGRVEQLTDAMPAGGLRGGACALAVAVSVLSLAALGGGRLGGFDPSLGQLCGASALGPTISISAYDPAGSFALRIRRGRVVAASIDRRPLPAARIVQRGERVLLVGERREPLLALTVAPSGGIRWRARA